MYPNTTGAPGPIIPAAELQVSRSGDQLVVRSRRDGREFDLLEMLGEYLSFAITNSFSPMPSARHSPRVTIDRFVLARESWTFSVGELSWCAAKDEQERYRRARLWRRANEIPERAFYRVRDEDKPIFVDFGSPPLVHLLARTVRKAAREDSATGISISEMLPDLDQCWLRDADGAIYTCELRLVAVDPMFG
jgi:Lantibiotic dehydratase, N terminus